MKNSMNSENSKDSKNLKEDHEEHEEQAKDCWCSAAPFMILVIAFLAVMTVMTAIVSSAGTSEERLSIQAAGAGWVTIENTEVHRFIDQELGVACYGARSHGYFSCVKL